MKVTIFLLLLFSLLLGAARISQATALDAWLDRSRVGEGDSVQLTLEAQGQVAGEPDTAPLQRDFDLLGMSTGSSLSIVNGHSDARTRWVLTLSPKHTGEIEIPALRVGAAESAPLQLQVSRAPLPSAAGGADVFIETTLKPDQPYVQQQVIYSVRLLHAVPIDSGQLSEPKPDNVLVRRLGEDREYATTRNGRHYQVLERRYALFAQASGSLKLPAPVFSGEIAASQATGGADPWQRLFGKGSWFGRNPLGGMLTPTKRVRIRGQSSQLQVRARPDQADAAQWLPAQNLTLQAHWQPQNAQVAAGEPLTLVLDVTAQGLTGGQLPDLAPASAEGFKVYPDQAQRTTEGGTEGVSGKLEQKIAFIPQRAGDLRLPEVRVNWWDTQADAPRVARVPARRVHVSAAAKPALPAGATAEAAPGAARPAPKPLPMPVAASGRPSWGAAGLWPWVSALLAVSWVGTLLSLWSRRRQGPRRSPTPAANAPRQDTAAAARKRFLVACQANDAGGARRALLQWAAAHWPQDPPAGLEALARRLPEPTLQALLRQLDSALYKDASHWDGQTLARCLSRLPPPAQATPYAGGLAPLYPDAAPPTA